MFLNLIYIERLHFFSFIPAAIVTTLDAVYICISFVDRLHYFVLHCSLAAGCDAGTNVVAVNQRAELPITFGMK